MNTICTFVDNSNLFIEGKRVAKLHYAYDESQVFRFRIDFGSLLSLIKGDRNLETAVLVGSRPPQNDSLWTKVKQLGLQPRIFDRSSFTGREKGVDAELINAVRDTLEDSAHQGTVALVVGDSDYVSTLERCLKKGWGVEIYFWSNASTALKRLKGAKFIELDQFLEKISFLAPDRVSEEFGLYAEKKVI